MDQMQRSDDLRKLENPSNVDDPCTSTGPVQLNTEISEDVGIKLEDLHQSADVQAKDTSKVKTEVNQESKVQNDQPPACAKRFVCPICSASFTRSYTLHMHKKIHKKRSCPTCYKELKGKLDYDLHLQSHMEDRPFVCKICQKAFKENKHLNGHIRMHMKFRPDHYF